MAVRAPKPWALTEHETPSSFESWKDNLEYYLSCDADFAPFLDTTNPVQWKKISSGDALRGLKDDDGGKEIKATEKIEHLKRMLGIIPQWVIIHLANDIRQNSTSMASIWQIIRKYYNFERSEVNFMSFSSITREQDERPERLYQRIIAFLQDNLLDTSSDMKYDGETITKNEAMSPTVYRLAVLKWMELIHPKLPQLVSRTYAHDLQSLTLRDLQPQICRAIPGFLNEIQADEGKIEALRAYVGHDFKRQSHDFKRQPHDFKRPFQTTQRQSKPTYQKPRGSRPQHPQPECRICKAEGRMYNHSLGNCNYMSKAEKLELMKTFRVDTNDTLLDEDDFDYLEDGIDNMQLQDDPSA